MNGMDQLSYCAARIRNTKTIRQHEHYRGDRSRLQFLIGDAGPFEGEIARKRDRGGRSIAVTAFPDVARRSATVDSAKRSCCSAEQSPDRRWVEQAERAQRAMLPLELRT